MSFGVKNLDKRVVAVMATAAMLFPAIVQAATFSNAVTESVYAPSTSITIPKPSGSEGDFMLAEIVFDGFACQEDEDDDSSSSCVFVEAPPDWTLVNITTDGAPMSMATYYKFAGETEASAYTWTFSSTDERGDRTTRTLGGIVSFAGVDASSPIIDSADADRQGSSLQSTLNAPSVALGSETGTVVLFYADNSLDALELDEDGIVGYFEETRNGNDNSYDFSIAAFGFEQDGETTDIIPLETNNANRWIAQTIALRGEEIVRRGGSSTFQPYVTVIRANGGETFMPGTEEAIFWEAYAQVPMKLRISLSTDGGVTFPTVIVMQDFSYGWYIWSVPDVSTTEARILVETVGYDDVVLNSDVSDANFTIAGTPAPEVLGATDSTLPDGVTAVSFIKLADDLNPDTQEDSTVYFVGGDNKAHPFISQPSYLTWYESFAGVQVVSAETLAAIDAGTFIGVRPGTSWVKRTSDDKVYYVAPGNVLRWIDTEEAALLLGGAEWSDNVVDLDEELFALYAIGETITVDSLATDWPQPYLGSDGTDTWLVTGDEKRRFASTEAFEANRFQSRHVHAVLSGWQTLTAGAEISALEEALVSLTQ